MSDRVSPLLLISLSDFLSARLGLHFAPERGADLRRGIQAAAREFGLADAETCIRWLTSSEVSKQQLELLSSHFTVGETYFFREKRSFEILETEILPQLIRSRRGRDQRLRIWSAACCTGEEAYSVAIVLRRLLPDLKDWDVTLLASDVNPRFLQKASEGVFGEWSFRDAPPGIKQTWFTPVPSRRYEIHPDLRKMVTFVTINLADDVYPSPENNTDAIDVILCRNVLIYLSPEHIAKWVGKLGRSLAEGGWLMVGATETSHVPPASLFPVRFADAIVYQKRGVEAPQQAVPVPLPTPLPVRFAAVLSAPFPAPPPPPSSPAMVDPIAEPELPPPKIAVVEALNAAGPPPQGPFANAQALFNAGRYVELAELLSRAPLDQPPPSKPLGLLARAYANQGRLADAQVWCEKAIAAAKTDPTLHYLRAVILQERGDFAEAGASLKKVVYLDPSLVMAHFTLGHLARQRGASASGAKHFENALRLLGRYEAEDILPESAGITASRLAQIISTMTEKETAP